MPIVLALASIPALYGCASSVRQRDCLVLGELKPQYHLHPYSDYFLFSFDADLSIRDGVGYLVFDATPTEDGSVLYDTLMAEESNRLVYVDTTGVDSACVRKLKRTFSTIHRSSGKWYLEIDNPVHAYQYDLRLK